MADDDTLPGHVLAGLHALSDRQINSFFPGALESDEGEVLQFNHDKTVRAIATGRDPVTGEELGDDARLALCVVVSKYFNQQYGYGRELTPERVASLTQACQELVEEMDSGRTSAEILADTLTRFGTEERLDLTRWAGLNSGVKLVFDGESQRG